MGQKGYPIHSDQPSPHEAYITRHVSGKNKDDYNKDKRVGNLYNSLRKKLLEKRILICLDWFPLVVESHA